MQNVKTLLRALLAMLMCLSGLMLAGPARAVLGANDNVPAATLLLPYFEVDLSDDNGPQTSIRVSNASASAGVVNVTLWTDWGLPTKSFSIYLTGYDTTDIDLRMVFKGHLPFTADDGADPMDKISPQGPYSQDINFPGCFGDVANNPAGKPVFRLLSSAELTNLRNAHTGVSSATFGGQCGAQNHGDSIARGYVTIDTVVTCLAVDEANPSTPGYFTGTADMRNIFVGSYTTINRREGSATSDALVHIESSAYTGSPYPAGALTFYQRFVGAAATDQREPLGTTWDVRTLNGGIFNAGTDLRVWRDPLVSPTPMACGGGLPAGFPLVMGEVAVFDEQENVSNSVAGQTAFPLATQQVPSAGLTPYNFGFMRLTFGAAAYAGPFGGLRQGHVSAVQGAGGILSASVPAVLISPNLNGNSYFFLNAPTP